MSRLTVKQYFYIFCNVILDIVFLINRLRIPMVANICNGRGTAKLMLLACSINFWLVVLFLFFLFVFSP